MIPVSDTIKTIIDECESTTHSEEIFGISPELFTKLSPWCRTTLLNAKCVITQNNEQENTPSTQRKIIKNDVFCQLPTNAQDLLLNEGYKISPYGGNGVMIL